MTKNRNVPRPKRLYQPPLPGTGDDRPGAAPAGRPPRPPAPPSATKRNRMAAPSRTPAGGIPTPRRAVSYGEWRLDEKTRRAGRQGVAAARAALAGTARRAEPRRADAA
ncbi:MAG TPA: hypothetical protein VID75_09710 [Acidimicrobiales bacterium]